ncbi:uncharacterized protein H6S33_009037 [Morchella sextelata]|uniref:uncharacterized protein n=1 Tax=Morchella sextelata TaxID=1174677 RepID=UPI001D054CF0|nr:uncharacterized protein H6S33_009037 [Morchella sextelata]KAH0612657.1 hypothetical protein H6S33_009037 [Morchella sextelata]
MSAKAKLITDSDSDSDSDTPASFHSANETPPADESGSAGGFKINAEYARRFEHNKKREELHRLEEKYGKDGAATADDDSEDDTDSEDEDDNAMLATLELDREINATLTAIRKKDPRVYDGKTTFYTPIPEEPLSGDEQGTTTAAAAAAKPEKPITLKDYHLRNLLSGTTPGADSDTPKPKTFVQEQADLKHSVVQSMHAAAAADSDSDDDDDDDDAFLTRKPQPEEPDADAPPPLPDLALADKNPDEFLNQFLSSRAWAASAPTPALLDDDSEDDETAEAFEKAYNFRFENPDVESRGTLVSYSRDAVSTNTVRREDKSARKTARERKREKREAEAAERAREMGRLRKLKMEELLEKVKVLQEAAGIEGAGEEDAEALERVLEGEWTEERVDEYIASRFGEEYYESGKADKPVFEDDIDIDDIVPGFEKEEGMGLDDDDDDEEKEEEEDAEDEGGVALNADDDDAEEEAPSKKRKSKKEAKNDERKKKQKTKELKRKLEKYVDDNYDFEAQLPPPTTGSKTRGFRYRETTPETYGLTSLDILTATDQDLNTYVGLKKLATFREPEKKKKDKKRYGKKKRLREWRKEVFGDEKGIQIPEGWKPEGVQEGRGKKGKKEAGEVDVVEGREGGRKRRKHKA